MSWLPYLFIGGIPGVLFGLILAGLLHGAHAEDMWWMGYAEGHRDGRGEGRFMIVSEGPAPANVVVSPRKTDGAA